MIRTLTAAVAAWLMMTAPSVAEIRCLPRAALIDRLAGAYGEEVTGSGLQSTAQILEIWASPETGSWTIFVTRPSGISCIIATGEFWQDWAEPSEEPDGEPT